MRKLFLLITVIPLIQLVLGSTPRRMEIPDSQCVFYYQIQPNQFTFDRCYASSNVIFNWKACLHKCCISLPMIVQPPSESILNLCNGEQSSTSKTIIIISIFLGSAFFVVIVCCLVRICCFDRVRRNRVVNQAEEEINGVEWSDEREINDTLREVNWSSNANLNSKLQNSSDPCTICLENMTTAELHCKHQFHTRCIGSWFRKNNACPCCRLIVKGVKVYCSKCYWKYMVCKRNFLALFFMELPQTCPRCSLKETKLIVSDSENLINFQRSYQFLEVK